MTLYTNLDALQTSGDVVVGGNLTVTGTINGSQDNHFVTTAISTVGNGTLTAAGLIGGMILRTGPTAVYTDTTATAAQLYSALGSPTGATTTVRAIIKNATAYTQTLSAGTGVTLPTTVTIPAFSEAEYVITQTSSTTATFTHVMTSPVSTGTYQVAPAVTTISTVGAGTITAAAINGSLISRGGSQSGTAFTDTTDTAANIIAACTNLVGKIGTAMLVEYANNTNATATITGGSGVTVSGVSVIPPNTISQFLLTYTAANTMTMVGLGVTQSVATAVNILGSSTGSTSIQSANAGSTNYTMTLPAWTGTIATGKGGYSTAQLDKTSDTALATITGMSLALEAGGVYEIRAVLPVTSNASGGAKVSLDTSDTLSLTSSNIQAKLYTASGLAVAATTSGLNNGLGSTAAVTLVEINATLVVNAAGTLVVKGAQNASFGTTTSFLVNASVIARRIA